MSYETDNRTFEEAKPSASGTHNSEQKSEKFNDDPTNLIVNYLPVYFTESHLKELFSQYGQIESLIVMYNKHDYRKKSKGYGFVKFSNSEEAAAAIKGVDGTRVANKTIKVSVARPGRARRSSNVFVSRLPVSWRDEDLRQAFKEWGHIVECRVLTFGDGVSRRCGFVRYDSDEQAKLAMLQMKNYRPSPHDAPLKVNLSVNHSTDAQANAFEKELALHLSDYDYMHGVPFRHPEFRYRDEMHHGMSRWDDDYIPPYGARVPDFAAMMHDPMVHAQFGGGREYPPSFHPEDYGYPDMDRTFGRQSGRNFHKWNRDAKPYTPLNSDSNACVGGESEKCETDSRLFVQNLPAFYEESHVKQLFSSYGTIANVTIQRDRHGKSIQCGFVNFTKAQHANSAFEALNGMMLSTQTLVIHVM